MKGCLGTKAAAGNSSSCPHSLCSSGLSLGPCLWFSLMAGSSSSQRFLPAPNSAELLGMAAGSRQCLQAQSAALRPAGRRKGHFPAWGGRFQSFLGQFFKY